MQRKLKVYGALKKFLNWEAGTFLADISNVAEVGRFLVANWPEVEKHMQDQHYKIFVGNYNIGEEELNFPIGQTEEIRIVPVAVGAKGIFKSTIGKIIIGAALIAAPYLVPATSVIASTAAIGKISVGLGISLAVSGVSQMLTPTPDLPTFSDNDSALDPQSNYSFSGVQNVSRSGVPVNLIFGEIFTGSVIVSAGIDTVQVRGDA
tara:strand:- start:1212 stop:1829 length:618 start_codon:yes stop_codon:yes gene_type:complete